MFATKTVHNVALRLLCASIVSVSPLMAEWLPPVEIAAFTSSADFTFDEASNGSSAVAWVGGNSRSFRTVTKNSETSWSSPSILDDDATSQPSIVINEYNKGVAVWLHTEEEGQQLVYAAVKTSESEWSKPKRLSSLSGSSSSPTVAIDAQGNAVAIWVEEDASVTRLKYSYFFKVSGSWLPSRNLSTQGITGESRPQIILGELGSGVAVWKALGATSLYSVHGNVFKLGHFAQQKVISNPGVQGDISLSNDIYGNAVAAWVRSGNVVETVLRPSGGSWGAVTAVSSAEAGTLFSDPKIGIDAVGRVTAIWVEAQDGDDTSTAVRAASQTAAGEWSAPQTLTDSSTFTLPDLAISHLGRAVATWVNRSSNSSRMEGSWLQADGSWSEPEVISEGAAYFVKAKVGLSLFGGATATYLFTDGDGNYRLHSVDYQPDEPAR